MSSPSNDPAQLLANLFENGQAMMRQFTATKRAGHRGCVRPDGRLHGGIAADRRAAAGLLEAGHRILVGNAGRAQLGVGADASGPRRATSASPMKRGATTRASTW